MLNLIQHPPLTNWKLKVENWKWLIGVPTNCVLCVILSWQSQGAKPSAVLFRFQPALILPDWDFLPCRTLFNWKLAHWHISTLKLLCSSLSNTNELEADLQHLLYKACYTQASPNVRCRHRLTLGVTCVRYVYDNQLFAKLLFCPSKQGLFPSCWTLLNWKWRVEND